MPLSTITNATARQRGLALPSGLGQRAVMLALLLGLGLGLLYPIVLTVSGAFIDRSTGSARFTVRYLLLVFEDPTLVRGLVNSLLIGLGSTALSIVLALPLAFFSARYRYPGKRLFEALILVPMILPPFVGAIGMQAILGREGALAALTGLRLDLMGSGRFFGVVLVDALHLYPIIYLNAVAALANLDPALDESAQNLGAGAWRRFFAITLPLIRPGLFAGATIVFISSFTELGTPLAFDYTRVTPVQIFLGLKQVDSSPEPYALVVVLLGASLLIYAAGKWAFGRAGHAMYAKASRAASERALGGVRGGLITAAFAGVTLAAVLPHVGVVLTALSAPTQWNRTVLPAAFTLQNFTQALSHPDAYGSIANSVKLAAAAVVLDMALGLVVAYMIVRTRVHGRGLLDALCMLPLAVPGLVMAFGYVAISLRWPFGKDNPLEFISVLGADPNPAPLLIAVYAIRRLPYVVRAAVAGLEQTSGELEEAAMNLGASRLTAVRRVIVPLIAANLIAGGLLAFSFAVLAVSEPLILAQQADDYPITKAIYTFMWRLGDGPFIAAAMGAWGMALLGVTLVGASLLMGKKLGSIFRV